MPISEHQIFVTFDDEATLGAVLDTVAERLPCEMWFRGESMEFPVPANPAFARSTGLNTSPIEVNYANGDLSFPLRLLTVGEREVVESLQRSPPADPYFPSLLKHPDHPAWFALARHHGHPTRLLDVSRDLLVALFFACSDHQDRDGFIFAYVDLWNPERSAPGRITDYRDLYDAALGDSIPTYRDHETQFPGTLAQHAKMLAQEAHSVRRRMAYLFECNDVINERMIAQRGAFIWRGDPTLSLFDGVPNVFAFRVRSGAKAGIVQRLDVLGINATTLRLK